MKRLKLKTISESPQQHNPNPITNDHIERFNEELKKYCDDPKSKRRPMLYTWYHTSILWPPDVNEDILIFQNESFSISRSFSVLQNLIYKVKVMKTTIRTEFHWMYIKTPSGKPLYENK